MAESERRYVIGMDCGTSNMKAIILDDLGMIVAEESRPVTSINIGNGAVEQNPDEWWENAVSIFRGLMENIGNDKKKRICALAISSHTVTMLPLDENRSPLRNALTCQDGRSGKEMYKIVNQIGKERFTKIVGGQPAVAFLPNKIEWYRIHEPELFSKTRYYSQASSYLNMKLTGTLVTDMDQAARTQCMDINRMMWSEEIGNVLGVSLKEVMPELKNVDDVIGKVIKEASEETLLPEGIPVLAGCSDALASMYAMGLCKLGDAGESSGTTSLVFAGTTQKSASDRPLVTKPCRIEGIPWIYDAPIQSTGSSIKWFIDHMAAEEKEEAEDRKLNIYDYLNELALKSEPGSKGVIFYPYLLGERAPLWNEYARGMFIGLGMDTERCDLVRSIFEGTAFALHHVVETIKHTGTKIETLRICGGGARSHTWCQIKASMLRVPVLLLDEKSGDVPVGTALLAGHKAGIFPNLSEAAEKIIKIKEVIYPIEEWAKVYDQLYPFYIEMYQKLDVSLKNLRNIAEQISACSKE